MTRWRKKVGDAGMEKLLAETIRVGLKTKAITSKSIESVNVDTTVQEKAVAHPTDARLYHAMQGSRHRSDMLPVGLMTGFQGRLTSVLSLKLI